MILVDVFGHMVATESEEELHKFAKKLGLKREWFQQPQKHMMRHAHYDLTTKTKIGQALDAGASLVQTKEIIARAWWAEEEIVRGSLKFWNLVARILGRDMKKKGEKNEQKKPRI